eukprot:TRINITY_DN3478_c0_g1_i1.p1 TRINITY_DN3478_c0_g1~~TRINITY_DN3478_c0_g1_i1.p1  ORF type:complete len:343 (-),score=113.51 TRINITY_DN3478_c0_g1_i1:338-1366(-)
MESIAKYFSDLLSDAFGGVPEEQKRSHHERLSKFLTQDLEYYFTDDAEILRRRTVSGRMSSTAAEASNAAPERIEHKLVKLLKAILCVLEKKQELRETVLAPAYELLLKAERVLEGQKPDEPKVQTTSRSIPVQDVTVASVQSPSASEKAVSALEGELKKLKQELTEKDHLLQELRKNNEVLQQKALANLEEVKIKEDEQKHKEQKIETAVTPNEDIDRQVRQLKDALKVNLKQLSEAERREAEKDKEIANLQALIASKEQQQYRMEDELRETKKWFSKREKPLIDERALAVERLEIMKKEIGGIQKYLEYYETKTRNTEELYSLLLREDGPVEGEKAPDVL